MKCEACQIECSRFGKNRNGSQRFRCGQCGKTYSEETKRLFGSMLVDEEKALLALQLLIEGTSIRSAERITGIHRDTIIRLLILAGERCAVLMDAKMQNLNCTHIQADEIWGFVAKKNRNVKSDDPAEFGDAWVFVALDEETKLIPAYTVGKRTKLTTYLFMNELRSRLASPQIQITTDGYPYYREAVEGAFEGQADFAQVIKIFGGPAQYDANGRYSPSPMMDTIIKIREGLPDPSHISTSYVERQNLTIRMAIRRMTRLTNAFSKKLDNHKAACALHFAYYNFCRIHKSLRVTPAMAANVTDHIWTLRELFAK